MDHLSTDKSHWPMLLDMTKDECKQSLRALELSTYSKIVSVLRAQGELTKEKRKLLSELQTLFSIPLERHRAEVRRAVNDEILHTVAERLAGPNTGVEWAIEGRRLIPLMPRVPPQVAYTALATRMAQIYCGLNANNVKPCDTSIYGKLDDVGADVELTDSEDETEGLRFLPGSMVPQQYNADQGSYSTLPQSQARLNMEKMKENAESEDMDIEKENNDEDSASSDEPPSMSSSPTPVSSPGHTLLSSHGYTSAAPQGPLVPLIGAEKRKRKRSISIDHSPAHPPPQPPHIVPQQANIPSNLVPHLIAPEVTQASALLAKHHPQNVIAPIRQHPNLGSALGSSSMKITVTGGITRSTTVPITSLSSHTPKVILVSTSAASGQSVNVYQRSISVPILKQPTQGGFVGGPLIGAIAGGGQSTNPERILKVASPSLTVSSSSVLSSSSPFISKIRPRFASMTSSILSQGSSCLPGLPPRPPRQRSNSLILQQSDQPTPSNKTEVSCSTLNLYPEVRTIAQSTYEGIVQRPSNGSSIIGHTVFPDSSSGGSLNFLGPLQLRSSGPSLAPAKNSIHVKQEGNKVIAHNIVPSSVIGGTIPTSVVGGRIIGRTSSGSQGLYVVSTTSGTITVVTRTVASGSISSPRVVTVNTINNARPSVVRGPAPATIVSVGMNSKAIPVRQMTGIRPVITGPKSNVIVVHKGSMSSAARPVGIQGLRDISAKIITKPLTPGLSTSNNISSLLTGTLVVKPSVSGKTVACVTSSKKDFHSPTGNMICSSSSNQTSEISAVNSNVIVLDFSHSGITSPTQSNTTALANLLHASRVSSTSSISSNSAGGKRAEEPHESINHSRRDTSISATISHDISTVSASSSLPSTRNLKTQTFNSRDQVIPELPSSSMAEEVEDAVRSIDFSLPCHITSSSASSIQLKQCDDLPFLPESSESKLSPDPKPSSSSLSSIVPDDDNEWLKIFGGEDIHEDAKEEDDEKSAPLSDESTEDGTDFDNSTSKTVKEEGLGRIVMADDSGKEREEDEESNSMLQNLIEGHQEEIINKPENSNEMKELPGSSTTKEGNLQMLVETAVDVLKGTNSSQTRMLSLNLGYQLFESSNTNEQIDEETFGVSSIADHNGVGGVSSSSSTLCHGDISQSMSTPLRDESSLGGLSELDPTTGYFCSPSIGDNSSEAHASNKANSITDEDEDEIMTDEKENEKKEMD